jgi:hypothetical protein
VPPKINFEPLLSPKVPPKINFEPLLSSKVPPKINFKPLLSPKVPSKINFEPLLSAKVPSCQVVVLTTFGKSASLNKYKDTIRAKSARLSACLDYF